MAMGSGISVMGKNTDLDANGIEAQQALISKLLMNAIQTPQQPDRSWTQGAARALSGIIGAYQQAQLQRKQETYNKNRQKSMAGLGAALSTGDPKQIAAAMNSMSDPQSQMMALEFFGKNSDNANAMRMKTYENYLDMKKPDNVLKQRISDTNDVIAATQAEIANEQDPQKRQQLQNTLNNLQKTQLSYTNQSRSVKGELPDVKTQNTNQYFQNLNQGVQPLPGQTAAYKVGVIPGPETKFQEKLGEGQAAPILKKISDLDQEAQSSSQNKIVGERLLQDMAANPDIKSGPGVQTMTGVKNFINNIFPGAFTPQAEQELFQKGVGSEVLGGIGQLRANGVQRITQNEIQYVVPLFTPTMLNSREGLKNIIELNNAIDPSLQRGQQALAALQQKARQDPNINLEQGINDIRQATQQDASTASMNFMNAKLASSGKKIEINPNYNPATSPRDKYIQADMTPQEKDDYTVNHQPPPPNQIAAPPPQNQPQIPQDAQPLQNAAGVQNQPENAPDLSNQLPTSAMTQPKMPIATQQMQQPQMQVPQGNPQVDPLSQQPTFPQPQQQNAMPPDASQGQPPLPPQGIQPPPPPSAAPQQGGDPSQSMLAPTPNSGNGAMPTSFDPSAMGNQPPQDPNAILSMLLARKQAMQNQSPGTFDNGAYGSGNYSGNSFV